MLPRKLVLQIPVAVFVGVSLLSVGRCSDDVGDARSKLPDEQFLLVPGVPITVTVPAPASTKIRSILISLQGPGKLRPELEIEAGVATINSLRRGYHKLEEEFELRRSGRPLVDSPATGRAAPNHHHAAP